MGLTSFLPILSLSALCSATLFSTEVASASAPPSPDPQPPGQNYSWSTVQRVAAVENPEIAAARENLNSAEAKLRVAYGGFLPSVKASIGYENTERQGATSVAISTGTGWTAGINGNWNLFSGFQDHAKLRQAEAEVKAAESALRSVLAKISAELKIAFQASTYAHDFSKLTIQILKRREENLRLVQLRFESGRENKGSVLLSEAYLEQARYDDLQARNSLYTSSAGLAKVLGQNPSVDHSPKSDGLVPPKNPETGRPDFEKLASAAPDYLQALSQAESTRQASLVARSSFLPSLDLSTAFGKRGDEIFSDGTTTSSIGLALSIPLFNGGKNFGTYQSARAAYNAATFNVENTFREQRRLLEAAWATYVESVAKLRADESFYKAAITRAEIARTKYNNGLLSFEDWDIIENDLINRQKSVLTTRKDRVTAEAKWEQVQGQGTLK